MRMRACSLSIDDIRRICKGACPEDALPVLRDLVREYPNLGRTNQLPQQPTASFEPLPPDSSWMHRPYDTSDSPLRRSWSKVWHSGSCPTLASSEEGSPSCSWPTKPDPMQRLRHDQSLRKFDKIPSPHPPLEPLAELLKRHPSNHPSSSVAERASLRKMRKARSCTTLLSVYPTLPSTSQPSRHHSLRSQLPGPKVPAATPRFAPGSGNSSFNPEQGPKSTLANMPANPPQEAAPALVPRTSLLTLAEAAWNVTCPEAAACDEPCRPIVRLAPPGPVSVTSQQQPQGSASSLTQKAAVDCIRAGVGAVSSARVTPFTLLEGLPAALHHEARASGYHRPVKVNIAASRQGRIAACKRPVERLADMTSHVDRYRSPGTG
jgi:hypothetical protein